MKRLLIATLNSGKVREFAEALLPTGIEAYGLDGEEPMTMRQRTMSGRIWGAAAGERFQGIGMWVGLGIGVGLWLVTKRRIGDASRHRGWAVLRQLHLRRQSDLCL